MMDRLRTVPNAHLFLATRVMAIVRNTPASAIEHLTEALYRGEIRVMEVTLNTPDAIKMISTLRKRYTDTMWVGAGTVLSVQEAQQAREAGAQFFVTPNVNLKLIDFSVHREIPIFSGALTPSEIIAAYEAGAAAVKVFPSRTVGSEYFKELRGPFPDIPLVAVGGIGVGNAKDFFDAGAAGIGVGGSLINPVHVTKGDYGAIETSARELVNIARNRQPRI